MASNRTKNLRLSGVNPLSYVGVNPYTPPGYNIQDRPPTTDDNKGFIIGDMWLDTQTNKPPLASDLYMLMALGPDGATWRQFGGGGSGALDTLTGNSGGAVSPDGAGNIDFTGDNSLGLTITGNPGSNSLTVSTVSGNPLIDSLTGDSGGAVPADGSSNINIVGGTGVTVAGNPGTNTLTINLGSSSLLVGLEGDGAVQVGPDGTGYITLEGGTNVTVTEDALNNKLVIAASGGAGDVDTLTGNSGGAVGVDGAANINVVGDTAAGLTVTGNPGTFTLTVSTISGNPVGETITGDSGGAVNFDASGNINIVGGTNCSVAGNPGTNTMTINVTTGTGDVDTLTGNSGGAVGVDGAANINMIGDTAAGLTVSGNPGTNTLTVTTTTGNPAIQTLTGDSGGAIPGDGSANVDLVGTASNITVTGAGNTLTWDTGSAVPTSFDTDSGTATPSAGVIQILGGSGITTAGASNIVTISSTGGGGGSGNQYAFWAYQASNSGVVFKANPITTGDSEDYLGATPGALTEVYDDGGNFHVGGGAGNPAIFTAPVDGLYMMLVQVAYYGITVDQNIFKGYTFLETTSDFYTGSSTGSSVHVQTGTFSGPPSLTSIRPLDYYTRYSTIVALSSTNTVKVKITMPGLYNPQADTGTYGIQGNTGGASYFTYWGGWLIKAT